MESHVTKSVVQAVFLVVTGYMDTVRVNLDGKQKPVKVCLICFKFKCSLYI